MAKCKVESCAKPGTFARGWCSPHYKRWYRYGSPTAGGPVHRFAELRHLAAPERFKKQTKRAGNCFVYGVDVNSNGYGRFKQNGVRVLAHRYAYCLAFGRIPAGKQVHHICDNRLCVNPAHLWVGTQSENIKDMYAKGRGRW